VIVEEFMTKLQNYKTAKLQNCKTAKLQNCKTAKLQNCKTAKLHLTSVLFWRDSVLCFRRIYD
jgi:hypothetical protein